MILQQISMAEQQGVKTEMATQSGTGEVLLRVQGLCKAFGGQQVLENVSLELHRGEIVLLRGANGSGKTTLLNILSGNLEPDRGTMELFTNGRAERFEFPQQWWQKLNPWNHFTPEQVAQKGVGRTWQDIRLFNSQSLVDNIAVATPNQKGENPLWSLFQRGMVRKQEREIRRKSGVMLSQLGLAGRDQSSGDRVSLGQSKRVAIARAVQAGARILFLDEPLAGLDGAGIDEVLGLLRELAQVSGLTLVVIEHVFNIPRILELATTVWTLDKGELMIESAATAAHHVQADMVDGEAGIQGWLESITQGDGSMEHRELFGGAVLSLVRPDGVELGEVLLEVEDLVVYRGQRLVIGERDAQGNIRGMSFGLRRGQLAVLQAPNGWGKTTLLEAIAGVLPICQGQIRIQGKRVEKLSPWKRVELGLSTLQARDNLFLSLTVREVLKIAQVPKIPINLSHLVDRPIANLSGGQKQKVFICCSLEGCNYNTGILDEPFLALDPDTINSTQSIIFKLLLMKGFLLAFPIHT